MRNLISILAASLAAAALFADDGAGRSQSLHDGWHFHLGDLENGATVPLDEQIWSPVTLPHTWNARDGQDGGNDYRRDAAWYRRVLHIPPADQPQRYFLRFGAASLTAEVFLDGAKLGEHRGGFTAFCFELANRVRPGGAHTLAVRVDNRVQPDVAPLSGDFTVFGGLYRGVELVITEPLCILPTHHGSRGVYLATDELSDARATIGGRVWISDQRADPAHTVLRVRVRDAAGAVVAQQERRIAGIPPAAAEAALPQCTIANPRRWDGRADPYLYSVAVALLVEGVVVDEVTQEYGLREFRVDQPDGFFLNGRPLDLHGVSRHQDREGKGWAISRADMEEDFAILRELGCTIVRLAHYPHDSYAYTLADRAGMVVWAEIPLIDQITDSAAFRANVQTQLLELIHQYGNHPSICFWGVHNEVTAPWKPGPDPTEVVRELHNLAQRTDPARPTVSAACDPEEHAANWQTDLVAFNRYFGWYTGAPADFAPWADRMHTAHPQTPLGVSEFGAGASFEQGQWPPQKPVHNGPLHPMQWQTHLHQQHWQAMAARPFLWCKIVWNGFDFASDSRKEGDRAGINDKGLVSYDRRRRKDAFYFYQANWSDEPMVFIAGAQTPIVGAPLEVFSNGERVTLFVDGVERGSQPVVHRCATFDDVRLREGPQRVRAVAHFGAKSVATEVEITAAVRSAVTPRPN